MPRLEDLMPPDRLRELAVRGAAVRIAELEAEIAALLKAFPELKSRRRTRQTAAERSQAADKATNGKARAARSAR